MRSRRSRKPRRMIRRLRSLPRNYDLDEGEIEEWMVGCGDM